MKRSLADQQDPTNNIEMRGYTDLVRSDAFNLEFSKRHAMTVDDHFAAHSVKPTDMCIDWEGKANPPVGTPKPRRRPPVSRYQRDAGTVHNPARRK
jgi:outer membrane protein OmpA-like peptidoglycan-associated protein